MPDKPSSRGSASSRKENVAERKKRRSPLFWGFSIIILVLIVLSFVVAPALTGLGTPQDSLQFGSYDGEPITFEQNNYFFHQYRNIASQFGGQVAEQEQHQQMYQIWRAAFERTVIFMDLKQRAEEAGLVITEDRIQNFLRTAGPYVDEQGEFDPAAYRNTPTAQRQEIQQQMKDELLHQQIRQDLFSAKVPPGETDFFISLIDTEKRFDYISFDLQDYPLEKTAEYAREHPEAFRQIDVSTVILQTDRADAETVRQRIEDREITFEEAARTYSQDILTQDLDHEGRFFYFELLEVFEDSGQLQDLFALQEGEVSEVVDTAYGPAIYQINRAAHEPDFEDEELLADIRAYMARTERGQMQDYFLEKAQSFAESADSLGFNAAAEEAGLTVHSTDLFPISFNDPMLMDAISEADPEGILAQASNDEYVLKQLFAQERGDMTQPLPAGNHVVVAICREEAELSAEQLAQMRMMYPSYVSQIEQHEYSQQVLTSDKLEDRFMQVFLGTLMQQ